MKIRNLKPSEMAKLIGIPQSGINHYLYEGGIPRQDIMKKIFVETDGMVAPNDFYGATPEMLEKELLKRSKKKQEEE